jgi:hypothetical protein
MAFRVRALRSKVAVTYKPQVPYLVTATVGHYEPKIRLLFDAISNGHLARKSTQT